MNRFLFLLFTILPTLGFSQGTQPELYMDICRFQRISDGQPYVQMYYSISSSSLSYRKDESGRFGFKVDMTILIQKITDGDTTEVVSENYNLLPSGELWLNDTTVESLSLERSPMNIHEWKLEPGTYLLRLQAVDSHSETPAKAMAINEFTVKYLPKSEFAFSDIKWVNGVMPLDSTSNKRGPGRDDFIPMVTNSTFVNEKIMTFYQEFYNSDNLFDEEAFYVQRVIYQGENRLWGTERETPFVLNTNRVNVIKPEIDITNLGSGTYYLQIELLNGKNRKVKIFRKKFYIYNPKADAQLGEPIAASNAALNIFSDYEEKELDYYIRTLTYRSTEQEKDFAKALEDYDQKVNYLYGFFQKRIKDSQYSIQDLWQGHLNALKYVNQHFKSSLREGWTTDRGRVFLRYGIPNQINQFPSDNYRLPYEIWVYDRLGKQASVRFVFYEPNSATNEYPLLHSDKYDERNNPRWEQQLDSRVSSPGGVDFEGQ
ncbi:GWxTD domain-containing protein [Pontibacter sp. G13]|uniref:GWxTD domain-containing protein n=1 Tax=Pontibacter sp. G13 TaxID=3074898 RepID=UPI002889613B|nr:GWxTD domain-containing protein [Pontibacter sp. G13]WNJ18503.1 GWxTD domain-containing protein [Pontibacter sp. G13]